MIDAYTEAKAETLRMIGPDPHMVERLKASNFTDAAQFEDEDGRVLVEFRAVERHSPFTVEIFLRMVGEQDGLELTGWSRDGNKLCRAIFRRTK